ncbi:MAG: MBL fold metallo-hydrolase [Ignavibacteriae bacterium]|nr:MBL fold metallo-hydrolase [Ignavibacteriota bacterium]MCB9243545.1 MBL fold metallo-hydrolase [Ignavibacteriales bacterium]
MRIGNYTVHSVQTGLFKLDGGAMFGVVPKPLWTKTNPSDDQNRIDMCTRALLLDDGHKRILVDTGIGYKLSEKLNKIYDVDFSHYTLERSLQELGLSRDDITDVILTHLHFDHAGGNTVKNDNDEIVPAFQNAVYHVQKNHYDWAMNPTERDRASFFPENYKILEDKGVLKFTEGEHKFDEVITLLPVNGHTRDMQLVKLSDGDNTLVYLADLIPTAGHIPVPYIMGYDLFPLNTLEEKKKLLHDIANNDWMIAFEHDPHNEAGKIGLGDKGYFLKDKFIINES